VVEDYGIDAAQDSGFVAADMGVWVEGAPEPDSVLLVLVALPAVAFWAWRQRRRRSRMTVN
jgi:hypothetical protein